MALSLLIKQRGVKPRGMGGGSRAGSALLWGAVVPLPCSGATLVLSCSCVRAEVLTVPRGVTGCGGTRAPWWGEGAPGEGTKGVEYIRERRQSQGQQLGFNPHTWSRDLLAPSSCGCFRGAWCHASPEAAQGLGLYLTLHGRKCTAPEWGFLHFLFHRLGPRINPNSCHRECHALCFIYSQIKQYPCDRGC